MTKQDAFEHIAGSLREFGYPDASALMVADVWHVMAAGGDVSDMPHGIVGRFAYSQLTDNRDSIERLP